MASKKVKVRPSEHRKISPAPVQQPSSATASRSPSHLIPHTSYLKKWLALGIAVFGILLYVNTIGHDYVLDDFSVIKENFVTKQGVEGIPTLWKTHARYGYWNSPGELYRPLTMTMFALEWQLAPDKPALSHFINILLYGLSGAVLFLTLARLLAGYNLLLPLLTTLFFMAHPTHVEVVANIKSRDEIVMFLLAILSINLLWKHLRSGNWLWLAVAWLCYLAALFSKENAVTFVAIVPLAMYFFSKAGWQKIEVTTVLYGLAALIYVLVRKEVIGSFTNPGVTSVLDNFLVGTEDPLVSSASAFLLLGKYLLTLIFPHPLGSDFGYNQIPLANWSDWRALLSLAAWVGIGVFGVIQLIRKDLWGFAVAFFLLNFSIFTNLFLLIGTSFGERLLYSASPGFALVLALALGKIFKVNWKEKAATPAALFQNKGLWVVASIILFLYSFKTVLRNPDWKTSYSLYEADVEVSPEAAKLNFHYGLEITKRGLDLLEKSPERLQTLARGKAQFEKAIAIYPAYHDAYAQLGLAWYREKNYQKALENYELAIKHKPNFPLAYSNMGIIFFETGNLEKAKECYEKAVQYDPRMVDALRNLGAVHAMQRNFTEAIKLFSQALQYDPENATVNFYLGSAYRDNGQAELGQPYLEKAYRLDPKLKK